MVGRHEDCHARSQIVGHEPVRHSREEKTPHVETPFDDCRGCAHTFDTVAGTIKLHRGVNTNVWWAGQWLGGEFSGLAQSSMAGAREPLAPKPAWKPAG